MQETVKIARIDETGRWVRCGCCGHKLFKIEQGSFYGEIEVKCSSCKSINVFGASSKPQWWIFTFGVGQKNEGKYVRIFGTWASARMEMIDKYSMNWSRQYSEAEWNSWKNRAKRNGWPVEKELEDF